YDRAEKARQDRKKSELTAEHFADHLDGKALKHLDRGNVAVRDVAAELEQGYRLFVKSRCNQCHSGSLFTDQDYHNIGVGSELVSGPGRIATLPLGLKDTRYIGAFRTPSLRNLSRTRPYMHDGQKETLFDVLHYYAN